MQLYYLQNINLAANIDIPLQHVTLRESEEMLDVQDLLRFYGYSSRIRLSLLDMIIARILQFQRVIYRSLDSARPSPCKSYYAI